MCDYEAQLCVDVRDRNALITILGHTTCGGKLTKHWGSMQYPTIYCVVLLLYADFFYYMFIYRKLCAEAF